MDWVLGPIAPLCCSIAWDHRCLPCYAKEAVGNETLCLSASASAKVHVHAIMDRGYILDSSHQCQMHDEASHHKCCAYQTSLPPLLIPITPGSSNLTHAPNCQGLADMCIEHSSFSETTHPSCLHIAITAISVSYDTSRVLRFLRVLGC
jgi:hypothetical protein